MITHTLSISSLSHSIMNEMTEQPPVKYSAFSKVPFEKMKPPWGFQNDFKKMLLLFGYSLIQDRLSKNHSETSMPTSLIIIVPAARQYFQYFTADAIDKSIRLINSPALKAAQFAL